MHVKNAVLSIINTMNGKRLAFKTYQTESIHRMVGTELNRDMCEAIESEMDESGFITFPSFQDDLGSVRFVRRDSVLGKMLDAFHEVDDDAGRTLSNFLNNLKKHKRTENEEWQNWHEYRSK